jgi:hypothetical protein
MPDTDLSLLLQMDGGSRLKFEEDHRFMRESVFTGLANLNTGFDSPLIYHFSPINFRTVIDRCEHWHVGIIGIEVFEVTAAAAELLEVEISSEDGYEWTRRLVRRYDAMPNVTMSATFHVPDAALKSSDASRMGSEL